MKYWLLESVLSDRPSDPKIRARMTSPENLGASLKRLATKTNDAPVNGFHRYASGAEVSEKVYRERVRDRLKRRILSRAAGIDAAKGPEEGFKFRSQVAKGGEAYEKAYEGHLPRALRRIGADKSADSATKRNYNWDHTPTGKKVLGAAAVVGAVGLGAYAYHRYKKAKEERQVARQYRAHYQRMQKYAPKTAGTPAPPPPNYPFKD